MPTDRTGEHEILPFLVTLILGMCHCSLVAGGNVSRHQVRCVTSRELATGTTMFAEQVARLVRESMPTGSTVMWPI